MLIDSHSHFDAAEFDPDRACAYQRARAVGVAAQVLPAISARLWLTLKAVAEQYDGLYPAYGLHPIFLAEHRPEHLTELADWLTRERPVAVGEIGLDFYLPNLDPDRQAAFFTGQLQLAREFELPVIVHARRAVDQVIKHLRRYPGLRGVVHSFAGSEQQAGQLLDLGFFLGFGGPITYPRAQRLHRLVRTLPLERLLLETDAPDQPSVDHRGQRNEPGFLPTILARVAALRAQDPAEIAAATTRNAEELFGLCLTPTPALKS